ncbi:hypothetical protein HRK28_16940 [Rathayibacter sp. VKM Ac-2835]|uniref:hypothetical protein n=1 Tax=Rathayibacter sp. VKM Ac-2835 TaxID=2739043 RepID=UPI0015642E65|nr:hypothetical protein [Rathayibacter sp. VKM Ac-2835]NRG42601.1 hypothetical protein [Rathayibacter sp. VKM Ac-2835]
MLSRRTPTTAADTLATLLALIGVFSGLTSTVLAAVGTVTSRLFLVGCAGTFRSVLLEVNDPPVDCLVGPEWSFIWWFALVGVGALLTFSALVIGSYRPRWAVPVCGVLAVITSVSAVLTFPGSGG